MERANLEQRIQTVCLLVLTAFALGATLYFMGPVLIPLVLAVFLSYCLAPVVDLLHRRLRLPQWLALVAATVLGLVTLIFMGLAVAIAVRDLQANATEYQSQARDLLHRALDHLGPLGLDRARLQEVLSEQQQSLTQTAISALVGSITSVLSNGVLVLIFMIFMLMGQAVWAPQTQGLRTEIELSIRRYVVTKVVLSVVTGVLVWLALLVCGAPMALVFGVLAFLLNFIPNIGSIIATLLPLPVILVSPDMSVAAKAMAFLGPGAIQFVLGNLLEPRVMGKSLDLHPVAVLVALAAFGMVWGIVGMFLATPIAAVLKILLQKSSYTAPVAALLAGRIEPLSMRNSPPGPADTGTTDDAATGATDQAEPSGPAPTTADAPAPAAGPRSAPPVAPPSGNSAPARRSSPS